METNWPEVPNRVIQKSLVSSFFSLHDRKVTQTFVLRYSRHTASSVSIQGIYNYLEIAVEKICFLSPNKCSIPDVL